MYKVKFSEEGQNLVARVTLPSPGGPIVVKAEVPMIRIQEEVKRFISANTETVGDDLATIQNIPEITRRTAKRRLIRKLHDNVGAWPGGHKTEGINTAAVKLLADSRGSDPVARRVAMRKLYIIRQEAERGVPAAAISLAALRRNNQTTESEA